jgi:hypothetical protein
MIETYHYAHNVNGVKISQCFAIKHEKELVGGIIFGLMSTTGWKKFSDDEYKVLELRRLYIMDSVGRNAESYCISQAIKWLKLNFQHVETIVSYADPKAGHKGTIYRASNFKYEGITGGDIGYYDKESGKTYHSRTIRNKYKGELKPFAKKLWDKRMRGELKEVTLPSKHCYSYKMKRKRTELTGRVRYPRILDDTMVDAWL